MDGEQAGGGARVKEGVGLPVWLLSNETCA